MMVVRDADKRVFGGFCNEVPLIFSSSYFVPLLPFSSLLVAHM
jgi:hypothetical protein